MRVAAALAATLLLMCGAPPSALAPGASVTPNPTATPRVALPSPIPQPITRTSAAAQVAWVEVAPQGGKASVTGIDPSGKVVGRLDRDLGRFVRSADGGQLFVVSDQIRAYSALDGSFQRSYGATPGRATLDAAFSTDGRWLALVGSRASVEIVDLRSGLTQTTPLAHDTSALHPGLSCLNCDPNALTWSGLVFSPDSRRVYSIVDWGGPLRLTSFDVTEKGLVQIASVADGQSGAKLPSCGGPAAAPKVVNAGRTLAIFCHVNGQVAFFDLATLTSTGVVQAEMKNPFWLAPIFTPDGQLLYLHQYPAFGDQMQVIDLRSQQRLGPVPTPQKLSDPAPFAWLFPVAYAGGTPSTVPVSPDGLRLYAAGTDGITVLRFTDLKPLAKLAPGVTLNEVWVSGDGKTVFATDQGRGLIVIASDGSVKRVDLRDTGGFIASEHG